MKACILESQLEKGSIRDDLINRYFYFADNIGHCVCGVVREAVSQVLLQHFPDFLQGDDWIDVIAKDSVDNPTLRGFLVERVCISHIATYGLKIVDGKLEAMLMCYFWDIPDWGILGRKGTSNRQLFVPTRFNYEAIDGIIAHLNKPRKTLALFPIQITIAKDHSDSEEKFFLKWWLKYAAAIHKTFGIDYSISVTFIWIHKDQERITNKEKDVLPVEACGVINKYKVFKIPVNFVITDLNIL